jgi:uncharacterized membrane protein
MGKPTDQELDIFVAGMLRFGVTLSALVVLAGGLLFLRHPWSAIPDYSHFQAGDISLRTIPGIFHGAVRLHAQSIIQLGLIVLIATPVVRVVFCVVGFVRQRSHLYVVISSIVLMILLFSLANSAL